MDSDLRKKIADNAYAQLDIKFSHIGRNTLKYDIFADSDNKNKYSLDCAGLCIEAFRLSGIDVLDIDLSNYSRRPDGSSLMRHLCTKLIFLSCNFSNSSICSFYNICIRIKTFCF